MNKIYQNIRSTGFGDCMRACVASLFELSIKDVPNFMRDGEKNFETILDDWCRERNLVYGEMSYSDYCFYTTIGTYIDVYVIAIYYNGINAHAVIMINEEVVHDPFSKKKISVKGYPDKIGFFFIRDYSKYLKCGSYLKRD